MQKIEFLNLAWVLFLLFCVIAPKMDGFGSALLYVIGSGIASVYMAKKLDDYINSKIDRRKDEQSEDDQ
ncbi:MAG: hypothetical protein V8T86_10400 [Victivallis sp.]